MGSWETLFGSPSFVHTYLFHAVVMSSDAITPRCTTTLPAQETAGEDAQNEKRGTKKKKKKNNSRGGMGDGAYPVRVARCEARGGWAGSWLLGLPNVLSYQL